MKKYGKILLCVGAACVIGALVYINRQSNIKREQLAKAKQLPVTVYGEEKIYPYSEKDENYTTFDTKMKRRNGDVFEKNYSGIQLACIFEDMGIKTEENTEITVVCADNYEIKLTAAEINTQGNVYLITAEKGQPLAEADGSFMLVVNFDEFSTRWAKNVVEIKIK